jgi:hypothetical protein
MSCARGAASLVVTSVGIFSFGVANALSARIIDIDLPNGAAINPLEDHIGISLESGWISADRGLLQSIFSRAKSAAFRESGVVSFAGKASQTVEVSEAIEDPSDAIRRPLGIKGALLPDLPGDIDGLGRRQSPESTREQQSCAPS